MVCVYTYIYNYIYIIIHIYIFDHLAKIVDRSFVPVVENLCGSSAFSSSL